MAEVAKITPASGVTDGGAFASSDKLIVARSGVTTSVDFESSGFSYSYGARATFVTDVSGGLSLSDGTVVFAGGLLYVAASGSTAISDLPGFEPLNDITPDHWGATRVQSLSGADSGTDSLAAFDAMLDWAWNTKNYAGEFVLLDGYYTLSDTLDVLKTAVFRGKGARESFLHGNFTSGPIIRVYDDFSGLVDCGVTGGVTRYAAASDLASPGILFEGEDVVSPTDRNTHCFLENVYIYGQPGSAVHIVGPAFTGHMTNVAISGMKGHGFSFDRGQATGRTNLITALISGVCNINNARVANCLGHVLACGSPSDAFSTPALRIVLDNAEGGNNATDAAVRYTDSAIYLRGANYVVENCGLSQDNALAFVAGRNIHLRNNRILGNDGGYAYIVGTYDELPTEEVFIEGINVISPTAPLDPAVLVTLPAGETTEPSDIFVNGMAGANITSLLGTDSTMGTLGFNRIEGARINGQVPPIFKTADETVTADINEQNDDELFYRMAPNEKIAFRAVLYVDGDATGDFRVDVSVGTVTTVYHGTEGAVKRGTAGAVSADAVQTAAGTDVIYDAAGAGTIIQHIHSGYIENDGTASDLRIRWAQSVANNSVTVKAGSYLEIKRLEV